MKAFLPLIVSVLLGFSSFGQEIEKGIVITQVKCKRDTSQSYAIYLPTAYQPEKKWPVVYVFEPAARGNLPVEKYASVAEDLEFILVCSNNSKNGNWQVGLDAADAMFLDTQERFSIDSHQAFTMGFSGGSRLALSIATITKRIRGVIGVGAAQPPRSDYMMDRNSDFLYVGLVGNRDMNYQEHKQFASSLDEWGKSNLLLISELDHRWASELDFKIAMTWMFHQFKPGNSEILFDLLSQKISSFSDSVEVIDVIRLEQMMNELEPSFQARSLDKKMAKKEYNLYKKEVEYRIQMRDSLNKAIEYHSSAGIRKWLVNDIRSIQKKEVKAKEVSQSLMYARILDYVRAISIETGFRLINSKNYEGAKVCVEIWSSYSKSPRLKYWWNAKISALQGNKEECLKFLDLLASEGFDDVERIDTEESFQLVSDTEKFKAILNKIESN